MRLHTKLAFSAFVAFGLLATAVPEAFAWSCQAQADDGTYGYSYNYPNRKRARQRALAECNARTYDECYIVDCQPNG